jgi:hypothetical protein
MQRGEVSRVKRARLLSQNQIRKIVMDSESDKGKYYASADTEDEEERRPPSRRCSSSQPPSPDFSVSSSQDEDNNGNVAGQQPNPSQWTLPSKSLRRAVHTFSGAPLRESSAAAHGRVHSTEHSAAVIFRNYYFSGCGDESLL